MLIYKIYTIRHIKKLISQYAGLFSVKSLDEVNLIIG